MWRNDQIGKASVWFMRANNVRGFGMFNYAPRDTGWTIEAIADVNGDGSVDLIWRHAITGRQFTRLMRKTSVIGTQA